MTYQPQLAQRFYNLHQNQDMFVLPNVWNGGSAKIFEKSGFSALATTSAGIAFALGYDDGEELAFDTLLWVVNQITSRITVPLSVDFERGYGESPEVVQANARKLLQAGAVGFNLEDGLANKTVDAPQVLKEKIQALATLKQELGINFVINARTDCYWHNLGTEQEKLKMAIENGHHFLEWGADCVFVPGRLSYQTIEILANEIPGPLNIILSDTSDDVQRLNQLGVKRLSTGSAPARQALTNLIKLANDTKATHFEPLLTNVLSYQEANDYFI
ncbi:isocitrate lyase/phosphoenolpyruvate mutase family protein [Vagococcus sp. BWB3-3]|uniref:Isocitrate lyase/phosphoenolpyruvate mutase family protein n=1 Tax=Vagococcus allomyrinae TaxID=2794353 RepID=A0A940PGJ1_9ENTE|nr:isocitrate lyase/phosphoenolpyruvate mutase family protein [Vagococcus allomyrinae]MBP1044207.1 isocitrate lyase/phosphoenolpyruvate mutase family protein [Vagococcus allomyrinae]